MQSGGLGEILRSERDGFLDMSGAQLLSLFRVLPFPKVGSLGPGPFLISHRLATMLGA